MNKNNVQRWILWALTWCGTLVGQTQSGPLPQAQPLPLSGRPQNGSVVPSQTTVPGAGGSTSVNTINPSVDIQGSYRGSVPHGEVRGQPLALSLAEAIRLGVQYNVGAIGAESGARMARAQRLAAMARLLPDITGGVRETVQQVDLVAQGLRIQVPIPGFSFPTVVGPFNYFDARASFNESVSVTGWRNLRASQENARSSELSIEDSRQLVALAVSGSYLQIIAAGARIQAAQAQIESATAVHQQAVDRNQSGLNARIDVNRSLVELQIQQQRLTSLTNDFEKQKLTLARLIGLPLAQAFTLSDAIPYREAPLPDLDSMIHRALSGRADVKAAEAQVKAAEQARRAASAELYPSVDLTADYGATGVTPTNQAHGTFQVTGSVRFPIFRSGRVRADVDQADAVLSQRKAEFEDAKGRAEQDVRNAVLDMTAASQQVKVAQSNRSLAADTLQQARDRFRAGVADTVELVQAQESVATAEQDFISAVFALNLAQVSLARAVGQTEQGIARLVEGK